jgi:hypothetical protein
MPGGSRLTTVANTSLRRFVFDTALYLNPPGICLPPEVISLLLESREDTNIDYLMKEE